jgi:ketosteroid isomerase-like protein
LPGARFKIHLFLTKQSIPKEVNMPKLVLAAFLPHIMGIATSPAQSSVEDVASSIKAMERAALDRSDNGDVRGFLEISAPAVVYIDPFNDKPLYGRDALASYYAKAYEGFHPTHGEMSNIRVQVLGDVSVLSFNYKSPNKPTNGWNCTEIYQRTENGWRIVHTHWSFVKPQTP